MWGFPVSRIKMSQMRLIHEMQVLRRHDPEQQDEALQTKWKNFSLLLTFGNTTGMI